jgi:hypothetical protein
MDVINASATAIGPLPPGQGSSEAASKPASSAEHTPKISTTADIKRLQSIGALKIQQDNSGNRTVRWSVSGVSQINCYRRMDAYSVSGILERGIGNAEETGGRREAARRTWHRDIRSPRQ